MSYNAQEWAFEQTVSQPGAKFVLLVLAKYADKNTGECYPSQGEIAAVTGLTERCVRNHLRLLEDEGHIQRTPRQHKIGKTFTDVYLMGYAVKNNRKNVPVDTPSNPADNRQNIPVESPSEADNDRNNFPPEKSSTGNIFQNDRKYFPERPENISESPTTPNKVESVNESVSESLTISVSGETGARSEAAPGVVVPRKAETAPEPEKTPKPSRPKMPMFNPDNAAHALLAAFRSVRYPGEPPLSHTELSEYARSLRDAAADNVTPDQMRQATETALRSWSKVEMVNPRSVIRNMSNLLRQSQNGQPGKHDGRTTQGVVRGEEASRPRGGYGSGKNAGTERSDERRANGSSSEPATGRQRSAAEIIEQRAEQRRREIEDAALRSSPGTT